MFQVNGLLRGVVERVEPPRGWLECGSWLRAWRRAVGLGGGRQELRPCGPRFAPSMALNAPAQPHRPAP